MQSTSSSTLSLQASSEKFTACSLKMSSLDFQLFGQTIVLWEHLMYQLLPLNWDNYLFEEFPFSCSTTCLKIFDWEGAIQELNNNFHELLPMDYLSNDAKQQKAILENALRTIFWRSLRWEPIPHFLVAFTHLPLSSRYILCKMWTIIIS